MSDDLPVTTNRLTAYQKQKRRTISKKAESAIENGSLQEVIDSLTFKQRAFCEEFLHDMNASQAVIRAGYDTKYPNRIAFQLMENPAIRICIDALRAERNKGSDLTKDFVLRGIQKTISQAEEAGNVNAVLRGYDLLGRHLGMFVERTEISGPDGKAIEMKQKMQEDVDNFTDRLARLAAVK